MIGKVKTMNSKGFGFITSSDGVDWFFHHSDYVGNWRELMQKYMLAKEDKKSLELEFDFDRSSGKGPRAINVKIHFQEN